MRTYNDRKVSASMCLVMGDLTTNFMALLTEGEQGELLRIRKQSIVGYLKSLIRLVELYAEDDG